MTKIRKTFDVPLEQAAIREVADEALQKYAVVLKSAQGSFAWRTATEGKLSFLIGPRRYNVIVLILPRSVAMETEIEPEMVGVVELSMGKLRKEIDACIQSYRAKHPG